MKTQHFRPAKYSAPDLRLQDHPACKDNCLIVMRVPKTFYPLKSVEKLGWKPAQKYSRSGLAERKSLFVNFWRTGKKLSGGKVQSDYLQYFLRSDNNFELFNSRFVILFSLNQCCSLFSGFNCIQWAISDGSQSITPKRKYRIDLRENIKQILIQFQSQQFLKTSINVGQLIMFSMPTSESIEMINQKGFSFQDYHQFVLFSDPKQKIIDIMQYKYQICNCLHIHIYLNTMIRFTKNLRHLFSSTKPNESNIFFESVTSTVKGYMNPNYIKEFNPSLTTQQKSKMKRFLIYRYNPEDPSDEPKYISYYIDLKSIPPMYLDALIYVKDILDPTLSFRRSCREGICGSCSMNCDGLHSLACIREIDRDLTKPAIITPLGHMFVLKDLVVDMTNFYSQYKTIQPYLRRKQPKGPNERQYYQSVEDRKKLDGLYECVLCACCSTSCPSYWWHPESYLGPAVLMQAYRWIVDSRDQFTRQRLQFLARGIKLDQCQNIGMCTVTCPKGLNPQLAIQHLFKLVQQMNERAVERAL